jgi:uncharacterized circularly permuted ATP-grasp superfamily protein
LLTKGSLAVDSSEVLEQQLRRMGLYFGDRPLCSVLRPRFLSLGAYREIARASALVGRALEKVRLAAMADARLRAQFGLLDWEEHLVHVSPGYAAASPTSRLDAFYTAETGSLAFTEYNAETPAGAAFNDALARAFLALPVMQAFQASHVPLPIPSGAGVVDALLRAWTEWRGTREKPQIVILDWREVPTSNEFVLFEQEFAARGLDAFIGDPRDAEFSNGTLTVAGRPVTFIYKRVLIDELITREGVDGPVVRAVKAGAVCMVNSFGCKLLHKKASLAVLSDERQATLLDADERVAVSRHVPWTRIMEERQTVFASANVDLVPFVAANRERLVLKPNDDYGGKGIVLGWTVDEATWNDAIHTALAEPYIVQERVTLPSEPWPMVVDGALHLGDRMLDTAPFMTDGQIMNGCLTRISTDALLNVSAGGGANVPTFLVEAR